jgi:hypothetical protein
MKAKLQMSSAEVALQGSGGAGVMRRQTTSLKLTTDNYCISTVGAESCSQGF